jgi:hypothetical protein
MLQAQEQLVQMKKMLLNVPAGYPDVILVGKSTVQVLDDCVHVPLDGVACISEAERHPLEFEQATGGGNRCFRHILQVHRDLMVAFS